MAVFFSTLANNDNHPGPQLAFSTTFTPGAWKKGRYTSYMTEYEMIFELTNAIFWCNLMFIIVLQLMLMQLRWTSTQVDYTHKKTVRAYHSLGTLISPQSCFWKDDLQIGSYINARKRDQHSTKISPKFLTKHFQAKKTNIFWKRNSFGSIMTKQTKYIKPNHWPWKHYLACVLSTWLSIRLLDWG